MKTIRIYAVIVKPGNNLSQIAYDSIEKAQRYIEGRTDNPKKITDYKYQSNMYEYFIHDLTVE